MLKVADQILPFCFLKLILKIILCVETLNSHSKRQQLNFTDVCILLDAATQYTTIGL